MEICPRSAKPSVAMHTVSMVRACTTTARLGQTITVTMAVAVVNAVMFQPFRDCLWDRIVVTREKKCVFTESLFLPPVEHARMSVGIGWQ